MFLAENLVAPGGPSAPVWAFFTGLSLAVLAIIGQQLKSRSDAKLLKAQMDVAQSEATKAHKSAKEAQANTANISNGFASSVLAKLERIHESQQETDKALREHLGWHLDRTE